METLALGIQNKHVANKHNGKVDVQWDHDGSSYYYLIGANGKFDLKLAGKSSNAIYLKLY